MSFNFTLLIFLLIEIVKLLGNKLAIITHTSHLGSFVFWGKELFFPFRSGELYVGLQIHVFRGHICQHLQPFHKLFFFLRMDHKLEVAFLVDQVLNRKANDEGFIWHQFVVDQVQDIQVKSLSIKLLSELQALLLISRLGDMTKLLPHKVSMLSFFLLGFFFIING